MPVPIIVAGIGIAAGIAGVGAGVKGGADTVRAKKTLDAAKLKNEKLNNQFEIASAAAVKAMDSVGEFQLQVLKSFETFSDMIEKIQNRPEFAEYHKDNVTIPNYDFEEIRRVAVGAGIALGGLTGAAAGAAGGFAAAGATTAAVAALGTASTGTAIASLHGAAATNAILAALGGGSLAAGGGGIALGTVVLGIASAGIALLIGGTVLAAAGGGINNKAKIVEEQVELNEKQIRYLCRYFNNLKRITQKYFVALSEAEQIYSVYLDKLAAIVEEKTDWNDFSDEEKRIVQNTILLVGLLFKMCSVQLVIDADDVVISLDRTCLKEYLELQQQAAEAKKDSEKKRIEKKIAKMEKSNIAVMKNVKAVNQVEINEAVEAEKTIMEDIE